MDVDWTEIRAIRYFFQQHSTPKYQSMHNKLNSQCTDELDLEEYFKDLFIEDEISSTSTIAPDPIAIIRRVIIENVIDLTSESSFTNDPTHIGRLFASAILKVKIGEETYPLRNLANLERAAKITSDKGSDRIDIYIIIDHWHFNTKQWTPMNFTLVSTNEADVQPQEPEAPNRDNENQNNQNPSVAQTLLEVTNMLRTMQAQAAAANTANAGAQARQQQGTGASTNNNQQTTGTNIPWNPQALPQDVKSRHDQHEREETFTKTDLAPFNLQITDANNNIVTVTTNYYLDPPGMGPRIITRNGCCFDFTKTRDSKEKMFITHFPKLTGSSGSKIRRWYADVVEYAKDKGVYAHPYYLFRKGVEHLRGFTVGDDPLDDLPARYLLQINEWNSWFYTALRSDKVIPDTCERERATVQSYHGGKGYEVLFAIIRAQHPNTIRHASDMISSSPKQLKSETIQQYYFRYTDFLELKSFVENTKTSISGRSEISTFIQGATYCDQLRRKTDEERESNDAQKLQKYKQGALLGTLEIYHDEIVAEMKAKNPKPTITLPHGPRHRSNSRPPSRSQYRAKGSDISSITSARISLVEAMGLPEPNSDTASDVLVNYAYCQAVLAVDQEPRKFDMSRPCLVCGRTGHSFDSCPMLNDFEHLKRHRIGVAQFVRQQERAREQWQNANSAQVSQLNMKANDEWQEIEGTETEAETTDSGHSDFQQGQE